MIGRRNFVIGLGAAAGLARPALAQSGALLPVRFAYAAPGLSFAAIFLANRAGLWEKQGVKVDLRLVRGGPLAMAALTNNEVDFIGVASTDPLIGWDKGIKTLAIAAFTGKLAMDFSARKDWMTKVGITPQSPLEAKLKAFKGARIGASTIGGGPAQYTRYIVRTVGLDPDADMKILAVGFGASRMAALRTNQVDVTVGDAPEADEMALEGFASLYIDCAHEVPVFREFPYTLVCTTPEFAGKNPEAVRRVAHAIGAANDLFRGDFAGALAMLEKENAGVPAEAMARALKRDADCYPAGGRMSKAIWQNNVKVAKAVKMVSDSVSDAEGIMWTDKFAG